MARNPLFRAELLALGCNNRQVFVLCIRFTLKEVHREEKRKGGGMSKLPESDLSRRGQLSEMLRVWICRMVFPAARQAHWKRQGVDLSQL
jgi:hypothetical protein